MTTARSILEQIADVERPAIQAEPASDLGKPVMRGARAFDAEGKRVMAHHQIDPDDFFASTEHVDGTAPGEIDNGLTIECTDVRNAERLLELYADDLRFVGSWGKWLCWDGTRWVLDETGAALERAKSTARTMADEAAGRLDAAREAVKAIVPGWLGYTPRQRAARVEMLSEELQKKMDRAVAELAAAAAQNGWAKQSQMEPRLHAMVDVARSDPRVAIVHTMLDADPMLLNVANGTVDLRTGTLRPHLRPDLCTKLAPVRYDATAPRDRFEQFMREIAVDDLELVTFHKRFLGYALTGETREHSFAFWYGTGGNGKSVLAILVMQVMGDYAIKAMPDLVFRSEKSQKHETELCDLHGRRLVFCNETEQGRALNDGRIKDLTGGEPIRARRMREDSWQWTPTHKLVLFGQYKPTLRVVDDGMKRRTKLVPFAAKFEGDRRDKTLQETLEAESSGVLAWLVEGAVAWSQLGIPAARAVDIATNAYFREEDTVALFFESECAFHDGAKIGRKELRDRYVAWTQERGDEKPLGAKGFSQAVRDRGGVERSVRVEGKPRDGWHGVRLLEEQERDTKDDAATEPPSPAHQTGIPFDHEQ